MEGSDRKIAPGAVWEPGRPVCAVLTCGREPDAGVLREFCFEHATDIQRFRLWLRRDLENALDALAPRRHDIQ